MTRITAVPPGGATLNSPPYGRLVHLAIASLAVRRFLASVQAFGVNSRCEMYPREAIA